MQSSVALEPLELRDAPSIAGVTLQYGNLAIKAPNPSGNVAEVQIDPLSGNVEVTLNGASEEFAAASVMSITYKGGSGGGDTFTNDTGLTSLDYGHGGGNTFTGGSGYDFVYFFGDDNTFVATAGMADVFEDHGQGDAIVNPNGALVVVYSD